MQLSSITNEMFNYDKFTGSMSERDVPIKKLALGKQNIDPVPFTREVSTYDQTIRRTFLGELVRKAKFLDDDYAKECLSSLLLLSLQPWLTIHKIYYVPSRDSNSTICKEIAISIAKKLGISLVAAVFDWSDFPTFRKGMSKYTIENIVEEKSKQIEVKHENSENILLLDDTIWSGSTSCLAINFLKRISGYRNISFMCFTQVVCSAIINKEHHELNIINHDIYHNFTSCEFSRSKNEGVNSWFI